MFETMTYDIILNQLLSLAPEGMDKREGSILFDALAPVAAELTQVYIDLDLTLKETFADTASRQSLLLRAKERGMAPKAASFAVGKGVFNTAVALGTRFRLDQYGYTVTKLVSDENHSYELTCETAGSAPNGLTGVLVPVAYVEGLTTAKLTEILIAGEDEEETEAFRQRYLNSFHSQAFGGNVADYKEKVTGIPGVGGVKVYPVFDGGGTVKIVIISADWKGPTTTFLNQVQTILDPVGNQGEGLGLAPIGHQVTVAGVTERAIDIATTLTYAAGWNWEEVQPAVEEAVDQYFSELNKAWAQNEAIIVRISQLESRILALEGVTDIAHTSFNGVEENLKVDADEIVKRGTIHA